MNFYQLVIGAGLGVDQQSLIDSVNQLQGSAIQTSNGLFVAMEGSASELKKALSDKNEGDFQISSINPLSDELTPDMKNLVEKYESQKN